MPRNSYLNIIQKYEPVIGLEVHAQLLTDSKIFCGCSTKFGSSPNVNVCPVCIGHPGTLPVLNKKAVEFIVLAGLAIDCKINDLSLFARKNYFYPDLPKGYQISQYEAPVCLNGRVEVLREDGIKKEIGVTRIHLEEDAGKSIHDLGSYSKIDANRCGVPLIEIVSEPDINSPEEARLYLIKLRQMLQYLRVCDGNMEEGSFRCDANISLRLKGEKKLGVKTELKNMNSFKNVEKALYYEIERQYEILEEGGKVMQQTLLWNADENYAAPMRGKEEASDYRYFPDPDLPVIKINAEEINKIKSTLPELPDKKIERFVTEYNLSEYDAGILASERNLADYFEETLETAFYPKSVANWIITDVLKYINENKITIVEFPIAPENLGKIINLISNGVINGKIAKEVFAEAINSGKDPETIVKEKNLTQIADVSELDQIVVSVIENNMSQVESYLAGKEKVFGFLVGQIMKETKGKGNPKLINDILKEKLKKLTE